MCDIQRFWKFWKFLFQSKSAAVFGDGSHLLPQIWGYSTCRLKLRFVLAWFSFVSFSDVSSLEELNALMAAAAATRLWDVFCRTMPICCEGKKLITFSYHLGYPHQVTLPIHKLLQAIQAFTMAVFKYIMQPLVGWSLRCLKLKTFKKHILEILTNMLLPFINKIANIHSLSISFLM